MYERTTSSTTYKIPQCCCKCLGAADKLLWIVYAKEWTHEGIKYQQRYEFDIPICSICKRSVYRRRFIGVGSFIAADAIAWLVWQQEWNEWEIWAAIGIVIAGLVILCYFWFEGLPADTNDSGVPIFRNIKYQKLFNELNGVAPYRPEGFDYPDPAEEPKASANSPPVGESKEFEHVLEFGSATSIMRFPAEAESNYSKHLDLIEHLMGSRVFPDVRICGLRAGSNASTARLIVMTGSAEALQAVPAIYDSEVAGAFVDREYGGDWASVNAASTLTNVSETGLAVLDLGRFNELCQEIRGGAYYLDRRVA